MQAGRRGNRRSAAGGGRSEPVSRKCPDWRPRQWTGIGWHDGGQSPTPTHSGMIFIKCHCEERSDVAIRSPYVVLCGGEYGLPHQCAHWFAMTSVVRRFLEEPGDCDRRESLERATPV